MLVNYNFLQKKLFWPRRNKTWFFESSSFAGWSIYTNQSLRFALHHSFLYLIYDVLRLRQSSLGYGLLAKRGDWDQIRSDLDELTPERIQNAIHSFSAQHASEDPVIKSLMYLLRSVGAYEPHSFGDKLHKRAEIKGLLVLLGMAWIWLTLNPSDLRNPLVLRLAGLPVSQDSLPNATASLRKISRTSNPIAVAQFFHYVSDAFFQTLLRSDSDELGILGKVSGHYGVVETNGRGMLHLHSLVWLSGNFTFENLRAQVLNDADFKQRVIVFLESIIVNTVDQALIDTNILSQHDIPSYPSDQTDDHFQRQLLVDSHTVTLSPTNSNAIPPRTTQPVSSMGRKADAVSVCLET